MFLFTQEFTVTLTRSKTPTLLSFTQECMDVDIVINCIYLRGPTPAFINNEILDKVGKDRKLSVICDVSCDPNSEFNPLPLYSECTTWAEPALRIREEPVLDLISIDNLPSTLPREASDAFNALLSPALLVWPEHKCWAESELSLIHI